MVRQARSEATRRRIIDSAVELINQIGYPASGLADIIERAELTKGALYYHFDSKEAVATAIIEEGASSVLDAFRSAGRAGSPAMENIVHGMFLVADVITNDAGAQAASRLLRTFGGFNPAAKATYEALHEELTERVKSAVDEGDLRSDLDAAATVAMLIAMADGRDLRQRFAQYWAIMLPALVPDASLGYYQEFLARQSMRRAPTDS
jgi:AcrR family transcriptional regulator